MYALETSSDDDWMSSVFNGDEHSTCTCPVVEAPIVTGPGKEPAAVFPLPSESVDETPVPVAPVTVATAHVEKEVPPAKPAPKRNRFAELNDEIPDSFPMPGDHASRRVNKRVARSDIVETKSETLKEPLNKRLMALADRVMARLMPLKPYRVVALTAMISFASGYYCGSPRSNGSSEEKPKPVVVNNDIKPIDENKPSDQKKPGEQANPADQSKPADGTKPTEQPKPTPEKPTGNSTPIDPLKPVQPQPPTDQHIYTNPFDSNNNLRPHADGADKPGPGILPEQPAVNPQNNSAPAQPGSPLSTDELDKLRKQLLGM